MGRPVTIIITDEMLRKIELMAGWGLSLAQIAAVIGISMGSLVKKKTDEERVFRALEAGKAKAEARVGKSLFERATDGDVAAIRWWEMTRARRSAEVKVEQNVQAKVVTAAAPDWRALIGHGTDESHVA